MTAPALTPAPRRTAHLLPYALWQFRDYAINIALLSIILFGLLGALEVVTLHSATAMMATSRGYAVNLARMQGQSFQRLFAIYSAVGPIVALSGIISQDRSLGYVRFLFAKPVNPLRFYLQSFFVRAVGFFVVGGVLLALTFVAFGGIIFLTSALTKYDGLVTIAFLLLAVLVWGKWDGSKGFGHLLTYLFPPIDKFSGIDDWVSNVSSIDPRLPVVFPTKWVVWTVCYGVACLVLGVVMLRKRPLARA
jgi:hypothetical protein